MRRRLTALAGRWRDDGGGISLELALVFPAVLLLIMAILSVGLWFHSRNIALAAAQEGARVARTHDDPQDAIAAAEDFARTSGDGLLTDAGAAADQDGDNIVVTVTGESVTLVPGLTLRIRQQARVPRERFTTPEQG